jgi:hypothetical protein
VRCCASNPRVLPNLNALLPYLQSRGMPSRHELLRWSALSGVSLALLSRLAVAESENAVSKPLALEPLRYRTLEAVTERILPSNEGSGAREAKVMRLIDRQLAGELRPLLPAFNACAALFEQWSQKKHGKPFAEAEVVSQDQMIGQLSRAEIPAIEFPQAEVFKALHTLTLE